MPNDKLIYKKMKPEELIVLAQQEDYKALEELIRKVQHDVYATLCYMVKKDENISDLTQEILVKIAKHISDLKSPECFKGWVNHIITNTYYDYMRKLNRKPEVIPIEFVCSNDGGIINIEIPDKRSKPMEKCISSECEREIQTAIRGLPDPFRIAIILREFSGLSYEEIAKTTNSSIGTVKSRISRARIKLQEVLKNYI